MEEGFHLYIVRHAIAEARGEAYPDDTARPLSSKGIAKFKKVVAGLDSLDVSIEQILSSPLVRARQTADILAEHLRGRPVVVETHALTPVASYQDLLVELEQCTRFSSIALVGHEPSIGEMTGRLLGSRAPVEFKKGAVCRIDVDTLPPGSPGRLRWFATPKMLAKLGR